MKQMMKKLLSKYHILLLIIALGLALRFFSLSDNHVFFYFDQARDAAVSRQIIENADIKIQGPSVSGTNDSVYHGVLYYYLIGPVYTFADGNPTVVAYFLGTLAIVSIFISYQLGKEVFSSKEVGYLAAFFQAVSVLSIHQDTWLSNPTLSRIFVPLSYLLLWEVFFKKKQSKSMLMVAALGLSVALAMQSALQNIVLLVSLGVAYLYRSWKDQTFFAIKLPKLIVLCTAILVGISSMIVTELLMFKRGILSFDSLNLSDHSVSILSSIPKIIGRYFMVIRDVILPESGILSWLLILLLPFAWIALKKISEQQIVWLSLFFTAPIWLLLWHYRDPTHTFIGLEVPLFLLLSVGLFEYLKGKNWQRVVAISCILLITAFNLRAMIQWRSEQRQYFGIQRGAFLNSQIDAVEYTYQQAEQEPFTIATMTAPFAINATWNYLYTWYGQNAYGYVPDYVSIVPQAGWFEGEKLAETGTPLLPHFLIYEPDTTLSEETFAEFDREQRKLFEEQVVEYQEQQFGTIQMVIVSASQSAAVAN